MKILIRSFFRAVRTVLGPVMLGYERLFTPKAVQRSASAQAEIDTRTRGLTLYQYRTCPFCIRVRRVIARNALNVSLRDPQHDPIAREELRLGGGKLMVPCLRIERAQAGQHDITWLYESSAITSYLRALCEAS